MHKLEVHLTYYLIFLLRYIYLIQHSVCIQYGTNRTDSAVSSKTEILALFLISLVATEWGDMPVNRYKHAS